MMMWIRCPVHARPVATGIEMTPASFQRLPESLPDFRCSACGGQHAWRRSNAWLADSGQAEPRPTQAPTCTVADAALMMSRRFRKPSVVAHTLH